MLDLIILYKFHPMIVQVVLFVLKLVQIKHLKWYHIKIKQQKPMIHGNSVINYQLKIMLLVHIQLKGHNF